MFARSKHVVALALLVAFVIVAQPGQTNAAFSGTNGLIAFQSNVNHTAFGPDFGQFEIYVMNPDGSDKTRLTTAGADHPVWSPDGKRIAFASARDGNGEIYVMNADGSAQTRITNRPSATDIFPTWSSDRSKIAFASFDCCPGGANYDIWSMNADGSSQTNLTNNPAEDILPAWQPGGSKIAFQTNRDGNPEIYTMNADGTGLKNLTNNPTSFDENPNWSPDGSQIAFDSSAGFGTDIYVMNADGSGLTQLTSGHEDSQPAFSPDGSKIVFKSSRDFNDEIYVMNSDGSEATRLTDNAPRGSTLPQDWFPDWQPLTASDSRAPVLTVPSDITTNADSPAGAVVTYSATATDDIDPSPSLTCDPPSGSIFAIGTARVICTATDASGNSASASFSVHVQGAGEQLSDLIDAVTGAGPGTSLADKVKQALASLNTNDVLATCSALTSFLHQVQSQSGKSLGAAQALLLGNTAQRIKTVLNC